MAGETSLFPGKCGELAVCAVQSALNAGCSGNASLLYGSIVSFNGSPFWILRENLRKLYGVSKRTITRYFRELVDAQLIVNKPAPLKAIPPGCKSPLPYRPWYKWAIGLPQMRETVRAGSKEAYQRWLTKLEAQRKERATRSKLGAILGSIVSRKPATSPSKPPGSCVAEETTPRRWSSEEIDAELARTVDAARIIPDDSS